MASGYRKSVFSAANFFERIVGDSCSDQVIVPNIKMMRRVSVEGNSIGSKQRNNVPADLIGMFTTSYIVLRRKKKKTEKKMTD